MRVATRVCREAGATVALNVRLLDLNVDVARQDERRIEVIANGLALWGSAQFVVDTTRVSPLTRTGGLRKAACRTAGAACALVRKAKERTYPEPRQSARCKLVVIVLACELGGRWSSEAATFVKLLAGARARAAPASSRGPSISAFTSRWSVLISFAAARTFVASLLSLPVGGTANVDGESPPLSDIRLRLALPLTCTRLLPFCGPCGGPCRGAHTRGCSCARPRSSNMPGSA